MDTGSESGTASHAELAMSEDPLNELDLEQIAQLCRDTERQNEILEIETQMFEKYFKRIDTKDLQQPAGTTGTGGSSSQGSSVDVAAGRSLGRKHRRSRGSIVDKSLRLTADHKCDIAQRETEEVREEKQRVCNESEKVVAGLQATFEETEIRLNDLSKTAYEFEREIVKGAVSTRLGKVMGEKVIRYMDDKVRAMDTLTEKLRLKNATLRIQKRKLDQQLKQKEEMGEVLHKVDFDQLKIENEQYLEKIEEKNQDLLRLKLMAGNTQQVLNSYKRKLNTFTSESNRLKNEIEVRRELVDRIDTETMSAETEREHADGINSKLKQQISDYKVPEVIDYVNLNQDVYEMKRKVKIWQRKVEIADMALRTNRRMWEKLQSTAVGAGAGVAALGSPAAGASVTWGQQQQTAKH